MHSTAEVGDHKIIGKQYSDINNVEWVNSDGMSKQENFFNTSCFLPPTLGVLHINVIKMYYEGMLLPRKS